MSIFLLIVLQCLTHISKYKNSTKTYYGIRHVFYHLCIFLFLSSYFVILVLMFKNRLLSCTMLSTERYVHSFFDHKTYFLTHKLVDVGHIYTQERIAVLQKLELKRGVFNNSLTLCVTKLKLLFSLSFMLYPHLYMFYSKN